jgi:hypothetical protein
MVIALIICIPITALVVGFFVLKSVQMGLRWQVEVKHEQKPTMESPVQPIFEAKAEKEELEATKEQESIINDWIYGADEKR